MKIGIVGMGLIGGSLAKSFKREDIKITGYDIDNVILDYALLQGSVDEKMNDENMTECDAVFLAISPDNAIKWMEEKGPFLSERNIVIDCCGTKEKVCKAGFDLSEKYGFTYAGGHPMAGLQFGGFKHSRENLFDEALFVIVPKDKNNLDLMKKIKKIILMAGFSQVVYTTAEEHDKIIAFSSQMPHIVSNAFIKSETPVKYGTAVSAGSYKDFTRVAYLDADMWTELFMDNKNNLKDEIDTLISELSKYRDALENNSEEQLKELLIEGRERKVEVDTKWD